MAIDRLSLSLLWFWTQWSYSKNLTLWVQYHVFGRVCLCAGGYTLPVALCQREPQRLWARGWDEQLVTEWGIWYEDWSAVWKVTQNIILLKANHKIFYERLRAGATESWVKSVKEKWWNGPHRPCHVHLPYKVQSPLWNMCFMGGFHCTGNDVIDTSGYLRIWSFTCYSEGKMLS